MSHIGSTGGFDPHIQAQQTSGQHEIGQPVIIDKETKTSLEAYKEQIHDQNNEIIQHNLHLENFAKTLSSTPLPKNSTETPKLIVRDDLKAKYHEQTTEEFSKNLELNPYTTILSKPVLIDAHTSLKMLNSAYMKHADTLKGLAGQIKMLQDMRGPEKFGEVVKAGHLNDAFQALNTINTNAPLIKRESGLALADNIHEVTANSGEVAPAIFEKFIAATPITPEETLNTQPEIANVLYAQAPLSPQSNSSLEELQKTMEKPSLTPEQEKTIEESAKKPIAGDDTQILKSENPRTSDEAKEEPQKAFDKSSFIPGEYINNMVPTSTSSAPEEITDSASSIGSALSSFGSEDSDQDTPSL
jgi:hypothetical protein